MSLTTIVALLIYAIVVCALAALVDWGWSRLKLPRYDMARVVIWVLAGLLVLLRLLLVSGL